MNKLKWLFPVILCLMLIPVAGCGKIIRPEPLVSLKIILQGDFRTIDSVQGALCSGSGDSMALRFDGSDSIVTSVADSLPPGNWRFHVACKHGILIKYRGEQTFHLSGSRDTAITVPLLPVNILILPPAWNSGLTVVKDTVHGNYVVHWTDYPDSQEFAQLGMQYTLVIDSNSQTINSSTVEKQANTYYADYRQTSQAYQMSVLPSNAYFMVFIYIRWSNQYWPGGSAPVTLY